MTPEQVPFSNGFERDWWRDNWCDHCANDCEAHQDVAPGCPILTDVMFSAGDPDFRMPEPWLVNRAAPDDAIPPTRIVCLAFTPCGGCGGDPLADVRAELVAQAERARHQGGER